MKKRLFALLSALIFVASVLPAASSAQDDYPYSGIAAGVYIVDEWLFYEGECTSFTAWRLNHNNGVEFTNWYGGVRWSNANNWDDAARSLGIRVDSTPAVGAVAQTDAGSAYGHVAWVSAVNGDKVTVEEYNYGVVLVNGEYHGNHKYNTRTVNASEFCYIHIKDLDLEPSVSFSPYDSAAGTFVSETNASLGQRIAVSGGKCTDVGITLYDAKGGALASAHAGEYREIACFAVGADLNFTLSAATEYKYDFFAVVNGKTYRSETRSFTTPDHTFGEWATTAEPTCTEQGRRERVCAVCGQTQTEQIGATGHNWGEWTLEYAPTDSEDGSQLRVCLTDKTHVQRRAIPPGDARVGDLTGDGRINSRDVIALIRLVLIPDEPVTLINDVNNDGKLNSRDVIALMRLVISQS